VRHPVCVRCQVEFRQIRSGVAVIDMFSQPPRPYQIWMADLFECPVCKARIVSGFGRNPLAQHFEPNFAQWLQEAGEGFQVRNYERAADIPGGS